MVPTRITLFTTRQYISKRDSDANRCANQEASEHWRDNQREGKHMLLGHSSRAVTLHGRVTFRSERRCKDAHDPRSRASHDCDEEPQHPRAACFVSLSKTNTMRQDRNSGANTARPRRTRASQRKRAASCVTPFYEAVSHLTGMAPFCATRISENKRQKK